MLSNNRYNKVKLLSDLSGLCWFLEKHAIPDADEAQDQAFTQKLKTLKQEVDSQIASLENEIFSK